MKRQHDFFQLTQAQKDKLEQLRRDISRANSLYERSLELQRRAERIDEKVAKEAIEWGIDEELNEL